MRPSSSHVRRQARLASVEAAPLDLAEVYRRHADDVGRWAARLAGPRADVEDLVHEVFLVVQRRLREFRGDAKLTTWLYEITVRIVQQRRRRERWRRLLRERTAGGRDTADGPDELARVPADQPTALEALERREATATLYAILDGVAEKYRTVLILFELEGLSGQEIAAITGTTLNNVWVRLFRAREKVLERYRAWEAAETPREKP